MNKCHIHPQGTSSLSNNVRSVCLKIYRDKDEKELSICFDNSCGALPNLSRIEACVFPNASSIQYEQQIFVLSGLELGKLIQDFSSGIDIK
jgi:hypothetical protein